MTVDGVDFRIQEPTPFNKKWFSHKFSGPGLRYELGVCIKTGHIVEFHGPLPCAYPDLKIFHAGMKWKLLPGERVIANRGYRGEAKVMIPYECINGEHLKMMNISRSQHETINGRLKTWHILNGIYHHRRDKHHLMFKSVAVLEQVKIENGYGPFQVNYSNTAVINFI